MEMKCFEEKNDKLVKIKDLKPGDLFAIISGYKDKESMILMKTARKDYNRSECVDLSDGIVSNFSEDTKVIKVNGVLNYSLDI